MSLPLSQTCSIKERVTNDVRNGLKNADIEVVHTQLEYGLTIYEIRVAGYIPLYVRFETHKAGVKSKEAATEDWNRFQRGFLKRCQKMLDTGDIRFGQCALDSDEYNGEINIWTGEHQLYAFINLTPLLTLRIPFTVKEGKANEDDGETTADH